MKEYTSLAVRIAGLTLIVFTLAKLPIYAMASAARQEFSFLTYASPSIIPLVAGVLLFQFPNTISKAFIEVTPKSFKIEKPDELLFVGCILIGIIFLFFSSSDLIFHVSTAMLLHYSSEYDLTLATFDYPSLIATVIELLFSLILIFKTKTLLTLIKVGA